MVSFRLTRSQTAPYHSSTHHCLYMCIGFSRLEVPEQTLGGIPLGLGMVMKINFFEFSCGVPYHSSTHHCLYMCIGFSRLEVPEQTLGGIPLGLGMVMKINFFEFSCGVFLKEQSLRGGERERERERERINYNHDDDIFVYIHTLTSPTYCTYTPPYSHKRSHKR